MSDWSNISAREAEKKLCVRLDRRRSYMLSGDTVHIVYISRERCSGCSVGPEETGFDPEQGWGCTECGGHGRRVHRDCVPLKADGSHDWKRWLGIDEDTLEAVSSGADGKKSIAQGSIPIGGLGD